MAEFAIPLNDEQVEQVIYDLFNLIIEYKYPIHKAIEEAILFSIENEYIDCDSEKYRHTLNKQGFSDLAVKDRFNRDIFKYIVSENEKIPRSVYDFYLSKRGGEKFGSFENFQRFLRKEGELLDK